MNKKLFYFIILIFGISKAQEEKFTFQDFTYITKMTREQLENKFNLVPVGKANSVNKEYSTHYNITIDGVKYKMDIQDKGGYIINSNLTTDDMKNEFCSKLLYVYHSSKLSEDKFIIVNDISKKDIPYFTYNDFIAAMWKDGVLNNNTAKAYFHTTGINFSIFYNSKNCTINSNQRR